MANRKWVFDKTARTIWMLSAAFFAVSTLGSFWLARWFLLWLGACFCFVALAFTLDCPGFSGKRENGELTLASRVFLWPYHAFNWFSMALFRRFSRGNLYDEIAPNLLVGARLEEKHAARLAPKLWAVVDLCAELSEAKSLREVTHYRSFPTLDTRAPHNLREIAEWILAQRVNGVVYVHCAAGRGRSATVICAVLLLSGEAKTIEEAREIVRKKRPMETHRAQLEALGKLI